MVQPTHHSFTGSIDPEDEDTLELELSPEQVHMLAIAAAAAELSADPVPAPAAPTLLRVEPMPVRSDGPTLSDGKGLALVKAPAFPARPKGRWPYPKAPWRGLRVAAMLGVAAAMVSVSGVAYLAKTQPPVAVPASIAAGSTTPSPPLQAPPVDTPVLFRNPFDATEVFEFPPGTSNDEARDAVAQRLLERARERQRPSVRTAQSTVTTGGPARR